MGAQMSLFADATPAAPRLRERPPVPKHPVARDEMPCDVCGSLLMLDIGDGRVRCHFCERDRPKFNGLRCKHPEFGEVRILPGRVNGAEIVSAWHRVGGGWAVLHHDDFPGLASVDEYRRHLLGLAERGMIDFSE